MTPQERLEEQLEQLDVTNVECARLCGVSLSTVQRWLVPGTPVPLAVLRLLELMVLMRRAYMPTMNWSEPHLKGDDVRLPRSIEAEP